ncbi:glycosyltransferase family 2 protein [Frondihabitans cladoniiphilus]|uniref:Glycosyltransferase family 2 protein n=1 Tax=Frondihabitans cladoniiphilus TaxID=715785 RepID=A0ABP8W618_9MICO
MLNIVIPMAGAGSRFAAAGFVDPKPLIKVRGVEMIRVVIDNLAPSAEHRFVFICQSEHVAAYGLEEKLQRWAPGAAVLTVDGLTAGAAATVLVAEELIDTDDQLMIANSDQFVSVDIDSYLDTMESAHLDGLIMTMTADDPKWSFVGLSDDGLVTTVVEKQVISNEATVGIYNFRRGSDFVRAAKAMIERDERSKGEFYVAPAYNDLIAEGQRIGIENVGAEADGMYGLGIPADLELFEGLAVSDPIEKLAEVTRADS